MVPQKISVKKPVITSGVFSIEGGI